MESSEKLEAEIHELTKEIRRLTEIVKELAKEIAKAN